MKKTKIRVRDIIDLIQCYWRTRDSDDSSILERSDKIVKKIALKHGYNFPNFNRI